MVQRSYRRKQHKRRFSRHRSLVRGGTHWTRRYLDHAGNFFSYPFKYAYHNHPFRRNKSKSAAHPDAANPVSSQQTGTANRHSSVTQSKQGNSNWTEELNKLELESPKTNQSWFTASTKPLNKSSQAQNKKTNDKSDENNQEDQEEEKADGYSLNRFGSAIGNALGYGKTKNPIQQPQDTPKPQHTQISNVGYHTKKALVDNVDQGIRTEMGSSKLKDTTEQMAKKGKELNHKLTSEHSYLNYVPEFPTSFKDVAKFYNGSKTNHGGKRRRKTRRSR